MSLIDTFLGTLGVTLPVFAMVFIGIALKRLGWIDQTFVNTASRLVFRGTLPTLIFLSLINADLENTFNPWLLIFFALATLASFLLCWSWAIWRQPRSLRGVYVQGAFRGNCGIVGMALANGMYGEVGLSIGGLLLGVVILTYNILSVVVLSFYRSDADGSRQVQWRSIAKHILTNPLILSVLLATPLALLEVRLPTWLATTGDYFASLTLPLALICIGATLSTRAIKKGYGPSLGASSWKMLGIPCMATAVAWLLGFEEHELGVMFLFFASPTASAAFVMAKAMGGDETFTANIIALTTLMASITITAGVFTLQVAGLI